MATVANITSDVMQRSAFKDIDGFLLPYTNVIDVIRMHFKEIMLTSSITESIAIRSAEDYKNTEKKEVNLEELKNAEIAKQILAQAIGDYNKEFKK